MLTFFSCSLLPAPCSLLSCSLFSAPCSLLSAPCSLLPAHRCPRSYFESMRWLHLTGRWERDASAADRVVMGSMKPGAQKYDGELYPPRTIVT